MPVYTHMLFNEVNIPSTHVNCFPSTHNTYFHAYTRTSSAMSELWHYIMQVPCGPTGLRSEPLLAVCRCCWHCASVTTAWRSTSACRTWPPSTSKSSSLRHRTPDFIWTFAYLRSAIFRGGTFYLKIFFICTNREVLLFEFLCKWSEQDLWPCSYSRTRFFPPYYLFIFCKVFSERGRAAIGLPRNRTRSQ